MECRWQLGQSAKRTLATGKRADQLARLRTYVSLFVSVTAALPKGAQRVAARTGVGSVHVEPGCSFSGRIYVAYAAPGFWFPSTECGSVFASTVRELADFARPEPIPADAPVPSGCTPAEPVAEPIEPTARAAWQAAPVGVDVVPFAAVSDVVRLETSALFQARRHLRSGAAVAFDQIAAGICQRIAQAITEAASGLDSEAVPVVVLAPGNAADAATLRFAGASYVLAGDGALMASRVGGPPRGFDTVPDAVAYAASRGVPIHDLYTGTET